MKAALRQFNLQPTGRALAIGNSRSTGVKVDVNPVLEFLTSLGPMHFISMQAVSPVQFMIWYWEEEVEEELA
jgi:hypothetical protein